MKLFQKTEVYRLTLWGVLLVFLMIGLLAAGACFRLYPFLAQTRPQPQAELLIIEGWIEDSALAAMHSDADSNTLFVTTGGPVKYGVSLLKEKTYAEVTTARLRQLGVSPGAILTASAPDTVRDRTYISALAVRRALEEQGLFGRPANLYSLSAHSRRSGLLYRFAFGPEVPLGVISLDGEEVDLSRWWRSSLAFKHVMTELMSWLYVQCTRWTY